MKKILIFILLAFVLIGCNVPEVVVEEEFSIFEELIYLGVNEGMNIPFSTKGIADERIKITFSNDSILEFDETNLIITALNVGYTKINLEVLDSDFGGVIEVYVEAREVKALDMQPTNTTINLENPFTFFIKNLDSIGAGLESFDFSFNDDSLATMDDNYLITPTGIGELVVTATLKSNPTIKSSFTVNIVESIDDSRIILTSENNVFKIKPGQKINMFVDGTLENLEENYNFHSYFTDIASFTADGKIIGTSPGIASFRVNSKTSRKTGYFYIIVEGETNQIDYLENFISAALSELGYRAGEGNYTKFGEWYQSTHSHLDWCQMFISYNANQVGIPNSVLPRTPKVDYSRDFFEKIDRFKLKGEYIPQRGDIVHFMDGQSHVGIVLKVENGRVYTVEGNTSRMVAERNYALDHSNITGYGVPDYKSINY